MTINKAIEAVDGLRQNTVSPEIKAGWIITVDGRVNSDIVKDSEYVALDYPDDGDTDLLVPSPYDELYQLYVFAQLALFRDEIEGYNAFTAAFNARFKEYAGFYTRTNLPAQPHSITNLWG